jgi:hypothetical protein
MLAGGAALDTVIDLEQAFEDTVPESPRRVSRVPCR